MNQRYAIVTGASKGIGLAVFQQLVEQGYDILSVSELAERNGKKLKAGEAYCDGKK